MGLINKYCLWESKDKTKDKRIITKVLKKPQIPKAFPKKLQE